MNMLKRFALILAFVTFLSLPAHSKSAPLPIMANAMPIDIIYIHGAYETKDAFLKSVKNVHEDMIEQLQSDPLMYRKLFKNGRKKIGEKEIVFFWMDETEPELKLVDKALAYAKNFGTKIAQLGRETLCHTLHDAIWVDKPENSKDILNKLNDEVKEQYAKGHEVLLYGYSAGSLLASQYMIRKQRIIELKDIEEENSYTGKYFRTVMKTRHLTSTCLDALTESKLIFYTETGDFVTNPDVPYLKETYPKLNTYTDKYCAPEGAVKGVVVFGAPLVTFDSGSAKVGTSGNLLSQFMMKTLVEQDLFFITVNYANDIIAMPLPSKVNYFQFEKSPILKDVRPNGGFMYDESGIRNFSTVISAHGSYWTNGKRFAKNVVKSYNAGYKYFYTKPEKVEDL